MQLPTSFSPIAETLLKLPQSKLAKLISLLLVIYIAFLLSKITWLFLDEPSQVRYSPLNTVASKQDSSPSSYNLSGIQALNLFGEYNALVVTNDEPEEIEDAPETNLKLILTGVAASDVEERAAAIIEHKGVQEIYAIDETITGTRAVLKKVYNDRVHIRHSGRLETLMLDGFDYDEANKQKKTTTKKASTKTKGPIRSKDKTRVDNRKNNALTKQAKELRNSINDDPGKITDYLKIAPKRENGEIIGYRLMPGKNPEFFKTSGLKGGDVAIQMNGYDLTQPLEAAQALKALKQEQEISLLVNRNSDITEILFSINE